jgi:hypothetical protein
MIALVDIDGTVADCSHRLHFIRDRRGDEAVSKDWDAFFKACVDDSPIQPVCELVRALAKAYTVIWVTGRPNSTANATHLWLQDYGLPSGPIFMRNDGDHRQDYIIKRELYERMILPEIGVADIAIEDRKQVVDMWRSLGILTLQPKDGDY